VQVVNADRLYNKTWFHISAGFVFGVIVDHYLK